MDTIKEENKSEKIKLDEQVQIEEDQKPIETVIGEPLYGPTILLESSFIVACIDPQDTNHKSTKSLLGFIEPHNCRVHIPLLVSAEVISKLIHKGKSVSIAIKLYDDFIKSFPGVLYVGSQPNFEEIVKRYKSSARKKLKDLQGNDFIIVTEGMIAGSIILTCDYKMFQKAKTYYEDIYFVSTDSNHYRNDIPRFVNKFLYITNVTKKHGA